MAKVKTTTNTIKLTPDEIKDLEDIRSDFTSITSMIGEVEINTEGLRIRKLDLLAGLKKLDEKQGEIKRKLESKYGKGTISLDTGEFTSVTV